MPLPLEPQPPPALSLSRAWLLASDPGWLRARRGAQAALSAVTTGVLVWLIAKVAGVPVTSLSAGVMVSIFGVVMVRETGRAQHVTSGVMVACSCLSATLAAALLPWWRVQAGVFLAVIFAAVYARRFGPRWAGAGMAAYISYLVVCYLRTPLAQVAWQWLGMAVGAAVAELWRAGLLREPPGRVLVGVARAIELQIGLLLAEIEHALRVRAWSRRRRRRLLRAQNLLAQDLALVEEQLRALSADEDAPAWALRRAFFELHLAAMRLSRLALHQLPSSPAALQHTVALKRAFLHDGGDPRSERAGASPDADGFEGALARLAAARPLPPAARAVAADRQTRSAAAPTTAAPARTGAAAADEDGGLSPALRQAIQTLAACGLAMIAGFVLSPQRWLWAVIAAYVVFAGVKSSGHVLIKGLQRTLGTVAGVFAGVALATLVSGHPAVEVPLLAILVFLTFYSLQASYAAMIFWLTLAIALLYGLLGYFKPSLLVLRLEETMVGSVAGAAVALVLFRTRTHEAVWSGCRAFLAQLRELVAAAADGAGPERRLRLLRDLTLAFQAVRAAMRPNAGAFGPPAGQASGAILQSLSDCLYFAEELAAVPPAGGAGPALAAVSRTIDDLIDRIAPGPGRPAPAAFGAAGPRDGSGLDADCARGPRPHGAMDGLREALAALEAAAPARRRR